MKINLNGRRKWLALMLCAVAAFPAAAQKERTITFNEDRAQHYMTTKVYELKYVNAHDVMPFILGAMKRFDEQASIKSLDYPQGKKQFVVVSCGSQMFPYIDEMIAKLDHPTKGKVDKTGSIVDGDGIYRYNYCSKYRGTAEMNTVLQQTFTGGIGSGDAYYDSSTNMFYWKTSKSQGDEYMKFLQAIDRPVPQAQVVLNIYVVNDNDFQELGIDYIGWKNGPGANLFGAGFDYTKFNSVSSLSNATDIASSVAGSGMGGFAVAPQFDATFVRMLAQKGKAKVASSAMLTLVNDYSAEAANDSFDTAKYRFRFTPQYQNIQKDDNQSTSVTVIDNSELYFYVLAPILTYNGFETPDKAMNLMCSWRLSVNDNVEDTNQGANVVNTNAFGSTLTLQTGAEKLLAIYDKDLYVKQYNGMPFLGDIPVLKYLVGSESEVKTKAKVFVTITATAVNPDAKLSAWAGQVIAPEKVVAEAAAPKK